MTSRTAARLAWSLWAASVAMAVGTMVLHLLAGFAQPEDAFGFPGFGPVIGLVQATVGVMIASRRPANLIGWLFLALAIVGHVQDGATAYAVMAFEQGATLTGAAYAAWVVGWIHVPIVGGMLFLILLFPEGRLRGRGSQAVAVLGTVGMLLAATGFALGPGPLGLFPTVDSPVVLIGDTDVVEALELGILAMLLAGVLAVIGLLRRWRQASGIERQQYKWLVSAGAIIAVTFVVGGVILEASLVDASLAWAAMQVLLMLGFTAIPVAVGIAILRYRLYEIDRLVSRTVTYALLVGMLAIVYVGGVLLVGFLLPRTDDLAVAVSTLAVAALFAPLRRRVRRWVDRRFNRHRYDAARVIDRFGAHLRDEVDLDALTGELVAVVSDTMQPTEVSLWLRRELATRRR